MRNWGIDLLRVIAIFEVVMLHTQFYSHDMKIVCSSYLPPANACFGFLSGFFLSSFACLTSSPNLVCYRHWITKRVQRLLVPYVIFEILYVVADFLFDCIAGKSSVLSFEKVISIVFFGGGSIQLWFVVFLFYVQVILSALWLTCSRVSNKVYLGLLLLFSIVGLYYSTRVSSDPLRSLCFLGGYCFLGLFARIVLQKIQFSRICIFTAIMISFVFICLSHFCHIYQWMIVLAWCSAFGGLGLLWIPSEKSKRVVGVLANAVMGVYLVHCFVTRSLSPVITRLESYQLNGYIVSISGAMLAMIISFSCVLAYDKFRRFKGES